MKRVTCINDKFDPDVAKLFETLVKEGVTYTVRDSFRTRNGPAYHLVEITNPKVELDGFLFEPSFHQDRFVEENVLDELFEEINQNQLILIN